MTDADADANEAPFESMLVCWLFHSLLNMPINYQASIHPMALLPASASASTLNSNPNIADLFTKPLPRHRFDTLIGDTTTITSTTSVASTLVAPTLVASPTVSDSVPTLHPNLATLPIVLDTGASLARPLDFSLEVTQASYGLFRSPLSVVSNFGFKASSEFASTPTDPYTLITGEDAIDLSCPDIDSVDLSCPDIDSDSGPSFTKVTFDIREFGTATLTFIYSKSTSELLHIFVDPTQIDWLHWTPLPRLILPESYFHIFGLDYLQAFTLFHLLPIWTYCLLHFVVNLED